MPSESPGLRPLTIWERGFTTIYGAIPSAVVQIILRVVFTILSGPDLSFWHFVLYATGLGASAVDYKSPIIETGIPNVMAHGMYAVFYFTYGRSLGHMAMGAHIVDAGTGRRMRNWQKAVRSALQLFAGYPGFWVVSQLLSAVLVLIDRERRRSLFDLAAGTVVVVGDPVADEPEAVRQRRRAAALLGRLMGREPMG